MSYETLLKLYNHELTPLTAYASTIQESGKETSLIETKCRSEKRRIYLDKKNDEESIDFAKRLHQFDEFFNKDSIYVAKVRSEYCQNLHGANAIGLYSNFEQKTLHVFFSIKKNEVVEEPPIPCSIYVMHGKGTLETGGKNYSILENEYYHICAESKLYIKNQENDNLEILYLGQP